MFRLLSLLAPKIPPAVAYRLCDPIGDIAYRLLARRRRAVRRNLSIVLGGQTGDLDRRAREVFRNGAKYYYDTFRAPALSDAELERSISLEGWDRVERALGKGRGAVIFTAHLGSPALVAQILSVKGRRVTTVAEPVRSERLLDLMVRVRGSRGIRLIPLGPAVTHQLTEALKRNEIVGLVADRDIQRNGVPVELFGAKTTLPTGPVMLALRTGAPLVPAFTYRSEGGRFTAHFQEPLGLERTGNLREDLRLNAQKLARVLEEAIKKGPEQWVVFEPIWSEGPPTPRRGVAS